MLLYYMDYLYSIILALVQAVTEFLPISSSGHLIIFHQFLRSEILNNLTFDVVLHAGTFLAVLIYFFSDIVRLVKGFFFTVFKFKISHDFNQQLPWLLVIGTIPAALIGYFFDSFIEQTFRSVIWVVVMLVFGGLLFIYYERRSQKNRNLDSMSFADSLIIGLAQVLAFIPGTSRSGITIVAAMSQDFKRSEAAKFSFLLSLPVILGATIRKVSQISLADFSEFIFVFILGAAVSALFGYLVIKYFMKFVERHSLTVFAAYRFALAAALIIIFLI